MKIKLNEEKLEKMESAKEFAMANARVPKADWLIVRAKLKARKTTWSAVIQNIIQQIKNWK